LVKRPAALRWRGPTDCPHRPGNRIKRPPVGVAYSLWCGFGIVGVTICSMILYKQKPDLAAIGKPRLVKRPAALRWRGPTDCPHRPGNRIKRPLLHGREDVHEPSPAQ
jgi:hypothetical protein